LVQEFYRASGFSLASGEKGFTDIYSCLKANIPFKKKRVAKGKSNELSKEQKQNNKQNAGERIAVSPEARQYRRHETVQDFIQ